MTDQDQKALREAVAAIGPFLRKLNPAGFPRTLAAIDDVARSADDLPHLARLVEKGVRHLSAPVITTLRKAMASAGVELAGPGER